jgi:hypothetical protein
MQQPPLYNHINTGGEITVDYNRVHKPNQSIQQRLPSISEVAYLAFCIIAIYAAIWAIMITTTNTTLQNFLGIFLVLSIYAGGLALVYYLVKIIKAALDFFTSGE